MSGLHRLLMIALFGFMGMSALAWALPAQLEMDRLLLAAERELIAGKHDSAREFLARIEPLEVEPPADYYRLYGQVLVESGDWEQARLLLERYVGLAGRESEHYTQALGQLTLIEQALAQQREQATSMAKTPIALLENPQTVAYDAIVQTLYMGDDVAEALVTHINGLLRSYVYIEGKIKNYDRNNRIDYSLTLNDAVLVLTQRDVKQTISGPRVTINVFYLNAFGVNPNIQYRCSQATDSCILRNPWDGKDWMKVAYDERAAADIATALTRLIQTLQREH